jgi:hypothetical protein
MTKARVWGFLSADCLSLADGFGFAPGVSVVRKGEIGLSLGSPCCAIIDLVVRLQNNPLARRSEKIRLDPCRFTSRPLIGDLQTVLQGHGPPFFRAGRVG